jgi:conjugative relaxase-like TrwC/TraI family protein
MLVMSKGALSAAQAETYYEEKYSQDDYYSEQHRVVGQWFGRGAEELSLSGEIASEDFRAVLRGVHPGSGNVLVQKANDDRRAGWDATFNAPKSVSVQALGGGDERLMEADRHAVSRALKEVEQYALSRHHGGSEWVVTNNVVAARFDQIAARPSAGADDGYGPDPHLHTHVEIANMTRRPDGAWRGLDTIEIYRSQSFASAVSRSELAREAQALGYRIKVAGGDGRWELEGYTREQVMAFSRRRQDIEQALSKEGLAGAAAAQNIAHRTRLTKDYRDEQSLRPSGDRVRRSMGFKSTTIFRSRASEVRVNSRLQQNTGSFSIQHRRERRARGRNRPPLAEARALQHAMGSADLDQIRRQSRVIEQRGQLIAVGDAVSSPQGAYTTPEMIALERDNLELMHAGMGRAVATGSADEVRQWASARQLRADQTAVAELTLTATDWFTAIEGRAAAAKTTTVGAIREFAEERGYAVRGFAPTTRAVKALSEAGISARTLASLLESRPGPANDREIWIIDESSLLPTRQVHRLLHKANDEGVVRVVFVGDQRQHHAIEAGRPIHQMQQAGMPVARLDTIRRQRDPQLREAVSHAAKGEIAESLAILERRGDIREVADVAQRRKAIAQEYVAAHEAGQRVLVVSPAKRRTARTE